MEPSKIETTLLYSRRTITAYKIAHQHTVSEGDYIFVLDVLI